MLAKYGVRSLKRLARLSLVGSTDIVDGNMAVMCDTLSAFCWPAIDAGDSRCGRDARLAKRQQLHASGSPETMLAPGVPSAKVAVDLTDADASRWPQAVVDDTMRTRYGSDGYHPAAAFDVLDLEPKKMDAIRQAVSAFYGSVEALPRHGDAADAVADVKTDMSAVKGMARFDHSADMPWHADRPAIAVFDRVAADDRLPQNVRDAASRASTAVRAIVLAHGEAKFFGPFRTSYADAAGPTAHLPTTRKSYDGWAEAGVTETHNDFFDAVDGRGLARAVGSYNAREDRAGELA